MAAGGTTGMILGTESARIAQHREPCALALAERSAALIKGVPTRSRPGPGLQRASAIRDSRAARTVLGEHGRGS